MFVAKGFYIPVKLSLNDNSRSFLDKVFRRNERSKVLFNQKHYIKINKAILVTQSEYFKTMLKPCYADRKEKYLEINVEVSIEAFLETMQFLINGRIDFKTAYLLEVYHLAVYLQLESLQELCLEHFTKNLTRNSLEIQAKLMGCQPFLDSEFHTRFEKFRKGGRSFVSGVYFVNQQEFGRMDVAHLNIDSGTISSMHSFNSSHHEYKFALYQFGFKMVLVMTPFSDDDETLIKKFDLLSGEDSLERLGYDKVIFCSLGKSLLMIKKTENAENFIEFSKYDEDMNHHELRKLSCLRDVDPLRITILLCQKVEDRLLLFVYVNKNYDDDSIIKMDSVHIMELSIDTMRVVATSKMTNHFSRSQKGVRDELLKRNEFDSFELFIYIKETKTLMIKLNYFIILVLSLKKKSYYFKDDVLPWLELDFCGKNVTFSNDKDDLLYKFKTYGISSVNLIRSSTTMELETFKFNKEVIEFGEDVWQHDGCTCGYHLCPCRIGTYPKIHSACMV